jgi:putative DNA primase/helicase
VTQLPEAMLDVLESFDDDERDRSDAQEGGLLPPPNQPMAVARVFVARHAMHGDLFKLRYWRGGWWTWRTTHWAEVGEGHVKSALWQFTEHARYPKGLNAAPWAPTDHKIHDLTSALKAICILDDEQDQPGWLDGRGTSGMIVSVANGLLDVERRRLIPHAPSYFNQTSVPFNYDPNAPAPRRWLAFLAELFPGEQAAIDALGEWFGYVVCGRTDLHKILLMVGPTRGGKGCVARILTALIGRKNCAGPTLNSLAGEFGLAPLIGKPLAVVSDARFAGKDASIMVERLLSISGEDTLTINRKYRDQWTGKLPTRIHILSNELPKLGDASLCAAAADAVMVGEGESRPGTRPAPGVDRHPELVAGRSAPAGQRKQEQVHVSRVCRRSDHRHARLGIASRSVSARAMRGRCQLCDPG